MGLRALLPWRAVRSFYGLIEAPVLRATEPPLLLEFKDVLYVIDGKVTIRSKEEGFTGTRFVPLGVIMRMDVVEAGYVEKLQRQAGGV